MDYFIVGLLLCTSLVAGPQAGSDPDALEKAAMGLVQSRTFNRLAVLLEDREFLARLDDPATGKTRRLGHIMLALTENASQETAALCHRLAANPAFLEEPDRMLFLLEVLAAVRPMTRQTADRFRSTNAEGYFASNARLLAANGSPLAVGLFEAMTLDKEEPVEVRTECLRNGILTNRTALALIKTAGRIFARATEPQLRTSILEAVFSYRREWSRPGRAIAAPPAWDTASDESLRAVLRLAGIAQEKGGLPSELRRTMNREVAVIKQVLVRRGLTPAL